ncbi:MAG: NADH-quinone oxidoreductase subunit M [Aeromicrobium sp.]|nr:MAG: NADH-quinone oxidoreductase subunit M [Aeromicrobium sp.]
MMLTSLILVPLLGAIAVMFVPRGEDNRNVKTLAFGVSLLTLAMSLAMIAAFDINSGGVQLVEKYEWIPFIGAWYALGINGTGLVLILLTTILTPIVMLASWRDDLPDPSRTHAYFAWMLVLQALAIGVFAATDVFLFYVFFEATLVPLYFLIGAHGGAGRSKAAVKFLIYNLVGGLIMLASIIGLYVISTQQGGPSFLHADLAALDIPKNTEKWLFVGFFIAFAIKAPMFPLHTWLPDAAEAAKPGTSVLMVSVIDKIGTFAMIRWCLEIFPNASEWASPVVMVLAVVSIIYGALLAMGQSDIRRLIAFTSVSHFGFIVLGIFAFTSTSMAGSILYMFNHGLSTAVLFLVTGMMISRRGSGLISDFGGVQKIAPVLSGIFLVGGLSSLSLPGTAPFVSEYLVFVGTYARSIPLAAIAASAMVLAALYILLTYQRTMNGPLNPEAEGVTDLTSRETAALTPAVILIIALGFMPQILLNVIDPVVEPVLSHVGVEDPAPRATINLDAQTEGTHE